MSKEMEGRRRGTQLEAALLTAAWEELQEHGYERLTFEAVAVRAGTSRPVLSRRWSTKRELALAALRHKAPPLPEEPPDTGDLRTDTLALLHLVVRRTQDLAPFGEVFIAESSPNEELSDYLASRNHSPGIEWMRAVTGRAVHRGEIAQDASLPDRLLTLPVVLVLHELFMSRHTPTAAELREIVDDLFLPLVGLQQGLPQGK